MQILSKMKIKSFYISLFLITISVLFLTAFYGMKQEEPQGNEKLINFSHEFHADEADCTDCHSAVEESTSLTDRLLPSHEDCANCHDVDDKDECETCHIDNIYQPLIQIKSKLIFNHKDHLSRDLKCEDCHKDFKKIDYSSEAEQLVPPMEFCVSCHNPENIAPNYCENCHKSTANLIPQNHTNVNFIKDHKYLANSFDSNCMMCHDNSTCEECHVATNTITEKNTPDDFYQPYMPSQSIDGNKQQVISRVHELNYRFTHGIDAKSKLRDCTTCHQTESFCANCHNSDEADFSVGGVAPLSHLKPDFKTIGVGSGGGEHAILARRDIERCASCHDVQGGDPVCITCHLDSDGIQGTNPKTHPAGFMRDVEGDWHNSSGSICFNCHTNASPSTPPGIGFCGYCHGAK